MRFCAYAKNDEVTATMIIEGAMLSPRAGTKFKQLIATEMNDRYGAAVALLFVGAFCIGNQMQSPRLLAEAFLQSASDNHIRNVFEVLEHKLHPRRFTTWVDIQDVLFVSWFARLCRAYQEYDSAWQCFPEPVLDLTDKEVDIINQIKETHCLKGHELPLIWEDPMRFLVPSNDEPFVVRQPGKNVTIITDGAICFKIKPLSDGKHFAVLTEYSNGKPVHLDQIALHKDGLPIIPTDADPHLWETAFTVPVSKGDTLSFKYNDKRIQFTI